MSKNILIKNIKKTKNSLKISWNDGKRSDFNFMWLRDNCSQNMHKDARQRIFNFLAVSEKIYPKKYSRDSLPQAIFDTEIFIFLYHAASITR